MNQIMTLCSACSSELRDKGYKKVARLQIARTTTKKADACQNCRKRTGDLAQYMVQR